MSSMRLYIGALGVIFGLGAICLYSCNAMPFSAPAPWSTKAGTYPSTQTPTVMTAEDTIHPPSTPILILTGTLHCTTYIESRWGTGVGELGFCPLPTYAWVRGPYDPVVSANGDIFIVDKANRRIVKYSKGLTPQVIPLPASYILDFKWYSPEEDVCNHIRWSNVAVSGDRLFLEFSIVRDERIVDQIAVLSLDGQEIRIIDLEPYYPIDIPFLDSLVPDREGGVYLLLTSGLVHFDVKFRPTFIYKPNISFEDPMVGWDGYFYTYDSQGDCVIKMWADDRAIMHGEPLAMIDNVIGATPLMSPAYRHLLGADTQGRLYFTTHDANGVMWIVRVSTSGDERAIAPVPKEWRPLSALGPDGALYGLWYDLENLSANPRVIRCVPEF